MQPLSEAIDTAGDGVSGHSERFGDLAERQALVEQGEQRVIVFGFPSGSHRCSPMLTHALIEKGKLFGWRLGGLDEQVRLLVGVFYALAGDVKVFGFAFDADELAA